MNLYWWLQHIYKNDSEFENRLYFDEMSSTNCNTNHALKHEAIIYAGLEDVKAKFTRK